MVLDLDPGLVEATLLTSVRMLAFLLIAPPFAHRAVPGQVRLIIGLALALAAAPRVSPGYAPVDTATFVGHLLGEALAGAALGTLVLVVFSAVEQAGHHIDLFGGFSLGMLFDTHVHGAPFSRLFGLAAVVLMFTSDAYQLVVLGLVRSYDAVPLGVLVDLPGESLVAVLTGSFLAGLQIAGPLLVVLLLADVGLGLVNRVAPQLNAFVLGFPLKILLTLTLVTSVFVLLPTAVSALVDQALEHVGQVR